MNIVYENPWFKVEESNTYHRVTRSGVNRGAVVLLKKDNLWVFVLNKRFTTGMTEIEAVVGGMEEGETPEQCAAREAYEESGFMVSEGDLQFLGQLMPDPGLQTVRVDAYFADVSKVGQKDIVDTDEISGLVYLSNDELEAKIKDGSIRSGITLSALQFYTMWMG